jgi:hypothetical protein
MSPKHSYRLFCQLKVLWMLTTLRSTNVVGSKEGTGGHVTVNFSVRWICTNDGLGFSRLILPDQLLILLFSFYLLRCIMIVFPSFSSESGKNKYIFDFCFSFWRLYQNISSLLSPCSPLPLPPSLLMRATATTMATAAGPRSGGGRPPPSSLSPPSPSLPLPLSRPGPATSDGWRGGALSTRLHRVRYWWPSTATERSD